MTHGVELSVPDEDYNHVVYISVDEVTVGCCGVSRGSRQSNYMDCRGFLFCSGVFHEALQHRLELLVSAFNRRVAKYTYLVSCQKQNERN